MIPDVHIYSGDLHRYEQQHESDDINTQEGTKISAHILSLYQAGEPLFSKELLRRVSQQLKAKSQKVSVRGLDGVDVDFDIETGQVFDAGDPDGEPFILYFPIQFIASYGFGFIPRIAYCSLWIFHNLQKRDRATQNLISPGPCPSAEEVREFFSKTKQAWEASKERRQLESILSAKTPTVHIKKIVAFACGGMNYFDEAPWAIRSAYQHALILNIRDVLRTRQECDNIECYAQDPEYTEIDKDVLNQSGITVLGDPQGFLEVDDSTLVLSFGPDIPVRQIIADIARPAMMIWDRLKPCEDELNDMNMRSTDPDSYRLRKMIQSSYEAIDFPSDLEAFKHTDIKFIARRILEALSSLHEDGIVHTDVKPNNILLDFDKDGTKVVEAKLSDCGDAWNIGHDINPKGEGHIIGAAIFRSPEAMLQLRWATPTDIWSFGATLISLIWGKNWHIFKPDKVSADHEEYAVHVLIQQARFFGPFPLSYEDVIDTEQNQILAGVLYYIEEHNLRKPFSLVQDEEVTSEDKEFICKIMQMDPRDRPTAKQLLADEWFNLP
ncbi:hypothetical protein DV738_g379, partial [Chaetothyriales sp. CBS 135597]